MIDFASMTYLPEIRSKSQSKRAISLTKAFTLSMESIRICAELNNASYYGRIFAKSGGIAKGIADVAKEMGVEGVKPIAMNGIAECKAALTKLKFNKATENFFEGMACDGGCLNGPVCITHSPRNVVDVDKYGNEAQEKTIFNSVKLMESL